MSAKYENGDINIEHNLSVSKCFEQCSIVWQVKLIIGHYIIIKHSLTVAIDNCDPNPCQNDGNCIDGINSFTCDCEDGFSGDVCEINIDDCLPDPCVNGGTCTDGINTFTCNCGFGFTGEICDTGELIITLIVWLPVWNDQYSGSCLVL